MARQENSFALLGDDEGEDPIAVIANAAAAAAAAAAASAAAVSKQSAPAAKLPSKPLPPAEAVRAERGRGRGGRGRGGPGRRGRGSFGAEGDEYGEGRGGGGGGGRSNGYYNNYNYNNNSNYYGNYNRGEGEDAGRGRGRARGRGRGRGFNDDRQPNVDGQERPRRQFDGNATAPQWEAPEGLFGEEVKSLEPEQKKPEEEVTQEVAPQKKEEKKEEDNEMTLDEYEKLINERRKALEALKTEERKVVVDRAFESMQLVDKRHDDGIFMKVSSEKDKLRKKESFEKEEKVRKSVSINEFLKPADGERYNSSFGMRGRGRGRGRGDFRGGFAGRFNDADNVAAPCIEDPGQFPVLGGK